MYGWRARIAMIVAHSNAVVEPEFTRLVPDGVSVHTARVRIGGISVEGNTIADQAMQEAVKSLSDLNARVFAWPCTAANIAVGSDGDLKQARMISAMTGVPTVAATAALIESLAALRVRRIALATPYSDDLNQSLAAFWQSTGIQVVKTSGVDLGGERKPLEPLSAKPVSNVGLQEPYVAYNLARLAYVAGADAVVVSGAGMRTIEAAAPFERDFGIPFISSSIATLWAALQAADIRDPILGYGRLLQEQPALQWMRIPRV